MLLYCHLLLTRLLDTGCPVFLAVPPAGFAVFSGNLLPSAPADFLTHLATVPRELPSLISLVRFPGRGCSSADVSTGVEVASAPSPIDSKNSNVPSAVGVIKLFIFRH